MNKTILRFHVYTLNNINRLDQIALWVQNCNRPFPQQTSWHVASAKAQVTGGTNNIKNGCILFRCARCQGPCYCACWLTLNTYWKKNSIPEKLKHVPGILCRCFKKKNNCATAQDSKIRAPHNFKGLAQPHRCFQSLSLIRPLLRLMLGQNYAG